MSNYSVKVIERLEIILVLVAPLICMWLWGKLLRIINEIMRFFFILFIWMICEEIKLIIRAKHLSKFPREMLFTFVKIDSGIGFILLERRRNTAKLLPKVQPIFSFYVQHGPSHLNV